MTAAIEDPPYLSIHYIPALLLGVAMLLFTIRKRYPSLNLSEMPHNLIMARPSTRIRAANLKRPAASDGREDAPEPGAETSRISDCSGLRSLTEFTISPGNVGSGACSVVDGRGRGAPCRFLISLPVFCGSP